ncbi:Hypothetical protein HDN1F_10090 [gamma proteobacterium HdN1]|nr:Hypothetical protein HDN1F_10090 [gamma proteobacterium HdN1]
MNAKAINQYRNLRDFSEEQWKQLDIHLFIAANFNRYCGLLLKKVGCQYLPSDATESLLGLYCSVAYKPLFSAHQKNLDAVGERRNQIMLGTLKMISMTRMVDALIQEYPAYIPLEQINEQHESSEQNDTLQQETDLSFSSSMLNCHADADTTPEENDQHETAQEQRKSVMVEEMRHHLTTSQYQTLRYLLCDRLEIGQIAEITGTSLTNVRIMLQNIRRRMFDMLPESSAADYESCLYRR